MWGSVAHSFKSCAGPHCLSFIYWVPGDGRLDELPVWALVRRAAAHARVQEQSRWVTRRVSVLRRSLASGHAESWH